MTPVKIVRIIARLNIGGPAINAVLLSEGLNRDGFKTTLVTGSITEGEGDMSYFAKERAVSPVLINELSRKINLLKDLKALFKIYKIIKKERPDIVHTHTAKAGALGRLAAVLAGVPVRVHTFHGHIFEGYFSVLSTKIFIAIEKFLGRFTTRVIVVSTSVAEDISIRYNIAPKEKIAVIPLGFDLEVFFDIDTYRGRLRKELGLADDVLLVGIVGRLVPIKNHKMFLDAAKSLITCSLPAVAQSDGRPGPPVTKFIIVGDGQLRQELEKYIEKIGIKQHVIFLGWRKDLEKIYADLDVVCLTSLNEGTPVSLIEAMASAKPVVATDVGGVRDIVTHGENGLLVSSSDTSGFGKALLEMLEDSQKRMAMGTNGRRFVSENFRDERLIRDMKSMYGELLKR
jgi:glycosyltransferase involved in cell wall biosynthesis